MTANLSPRDSTASDLLVLSKFWHTLDGIYLWEFVSTLDYEWSVIRGHHPYRWTIWIYSFTRIATLVAVVLDIIGLDYTSPMNCEVWVVFQLIFAYLAFVAASSLVVLRIIAIWNRNKIAVAMAATVWGTNISFLILGTVRLHSAWVSDLKTCMLVNTEISKPTIIAILVADVVLLLIMLAGLLRLRSLGGRLSGLLWKQGVIWLALAVVAEVPPVVFIFLDLNEPFSVMFQIPALLVMSVAATRMYRSLTEFASGTTEMYNVLLGILACLEANSDRRFCSIQDSQQIGYRADKRAPAAPILISQMGVAAHRDSDVEYPMAGEEP